MNPKRFFASTIAAAILGGGITLGGYRLCAPQQAHVDIIHEPSTIQQQPIHAVSLTTATNATSGPDLVHAAQMTTPAVVHIKTTCEPAQVTDTPKATTPLDQLFKEFFGDGFDISPREHAQPQHTAGSGVIIAADGYIVTNNHVIDKTDKIEVTLDDNRQYSAQVIGQDPNTDLALLKIKEKGLPYLQFGNSDTLQIGEWVLAVGNPFNLTSTVTKGIVSAKARSIDMLQNQNKMRIEAFIQTDAAVNRGNSGGALVNLQGELVGINTAIATHTGAFAGYAFAIPSCIVKKITDDLKKYGAVQRAMVGIVIRALTAELAAEKGLKQVSGIYVNEVSKNGAAAEAGIQAGDVIVAINGNKVKDTSQLQEQIARYKPNDKIGITYYRKNKEMTVTVTLKSVEEKVQIVLNKHTAELGGAVFENIDQAIQKQFNLTGGVRIKALKEGPWKQPGIQQGFVVTAIDKEPVENLEQFVNMLTHKKGGVLVEGCSRNGIKIYRAVDLGN